MLELAAEVTHVPETGFYRIRFSHGDTEVSTHILTPPALQSLMVDLERQAISAYSARRGVGFVIPDHAGATTASDVKITARSAMILCDQIRFAVIEAAIAERDQRVLRSLVPSIH